MPSTPSTHPCKAFHPPTFFPALAAAAAAAAAAFLIWLRMLKLTASLSRSPLMMRSIAGLRSVTACLLGTGDQGAGLGVSVCVGRGGGRRAELKYGMGDQGMT